MMLDKLGDLASKVRAIVSEVDPGAQNNPVSDWLVDVENLRERAPLTQPLVSLCIGNGARVLLERHFGSVAVCAAFEGSFQELLAKDAFSLGSLLFGAHFAFVCEVAPDDENLKWLAETLPVVAVSPADSALRVPAARGQEGGNPQWIGSNTVLSSDVRRSVLIGAVASRLVAIADALRRAVQALLASDRVQHEVRSRQSASDSYQRRIRAQVEIASLEAEQQVLVERGKSVAMARARTFQYLESIQNAERLWPRDFGGNPITEINTNIIDKTKITLRKAYLQIALGGAVAEGQDAEEPANLADLIYRPFKKLANDEVLVFSASGPNITRLVEEAHADAYEFASDIVTKHVATSLRAVNADLKIDLDKVRHGTGAVIDAGRTRRVASVLARTQPMQVPTSGFMTAIKWGYAAVRPYSFLILAGGGAYLVKDLTGGTLEIPRVFMTLLICVVLGLLIAALLYPGKARHERARLRNEYVDRNVSAVIEGLKVAIGEIIVGVSERTAASIKTQFDAIDVDLTAKRDHIAKRLKALADERKAAETEAGKLTLARDPRAALLANCRDVERTSRTAFQDWTRIFKVGG